MQKLAVVCDEHGERHISNVVRVGEHITNTHLLWADSDNGEIPEWMQNALDRHNADSH